MRFFDKLKEAGKKAGSKIKETASKEVARIRDRNKAIKMLEVLRKSDLTKFCREYGYDYEGSMTKPELIEHLKFSGGRQLTTKRVSEHFQFIRKKIPKRFIEEDTDVEVELEIVRPKSAKSKKVSKSTQMVTKIRKELKNFKPLGVRSKSFNERNLEVQLVQRLRYAFGEGKVNYQEGGRSGRVDIVVDGKYAIELKVGASRSELNRLQGQLTGYSEEYRMVFGYIYDQKSQLKTTDLNDLKRRLKHIKNVEIITHR